MGDDNKSRFNSTLWLLLLIVLIIFTCVIIQTSDEKEEKEIIKVVVPLKETTIYDSLDKDIDIAICQLKEKSKKAKLIIPSFPDFPEIWLLPSENKGTFASIPEKYCIDFLHLLFPGYKFVKQRCKFIRNPKTNYPLELDGYCEELMIALEYNGIQHYVWPNYFHSKIEDFNAQQERDKVKETACIKQNICLLRIPYTIPLNRIPLAIYAKLLEAVPEI